METLWTQFKQARRRAAANKNKAKHPGPLHASGNMPGCQMMVQAPSLPWQLCSSLCDKGGLDKSSLDLLQQQQANAGQVWAVQTLGNANQLASIQPCTSAQHQPCTNVSELQCASNVAGTSLADQILILCNDLKVLQDRSSAAKARVSADRQVQQPTLTSSQSLQLHSHVCSQARHSTQDSSHQQISSPAGSIQFPGVLWDANDVQPCSPPPKNTVTQAPQPTCISHTKSMQEAECNPTATLQNAKPLLGQTMLNQTAIAANVLQQPANGYNDTLIHSPQQGQAASSVATRRTMDVGAEFSNGSINNPSIAGNVPVLHCGAATQPSVAHQMATSSTEIEPADDSPHSNRRTMMLSEMVGNAQVNSLAAEGNISTQAGAPKRTKSFIYMMKRLLGNKASQNNSHSPDVSLQRSKSGFGGVLSPTMGAGISRAESCSMQCTGLSGVATSQAGHTLAAVTGCQGIAQPAGNMFVADAVQDQGASCGDICMVGQQVGVLEEGTKHNVLFLEQDTRVQHGFINDNADSMSDPATNQTFHSSCDTVANSLTFFSTIAAAAVGHPSDVSLQYQSSPVHSHSQPCSSYELNTLPDRISCYNPTSPGQDLPIPIAVDAISCGNTKSILDRNPVFSPKDVAVQRPAEQRYCQLQGNTALGRCTADMPQQLVCQPCLAQGSSLTTEKGLAVSKTNTIPRVSQIRTNHAMAKERQGVLLEAQQLVVLPVQATLLTPQPVLVVSPGMGRRMIDVPEPALAAAARIAIGAGDVLDPEVWCSSQHSNQAIVMRNLSDVEHQDDLATCAALGLPPSSLPSTPRAGARVTQLTSPRPLGSQPAEMTTSIMASITPNTECDGSQARLVSTLQKVWMTGTIDANVSPTRTIAATDLLTSSPAISKTKAAPGIVNSYALHDDCVEKHIDIVGLY